MSFELWVLVERHIGVAQKREQLSCRRCDFEDPIKNKQVSAAMHAVLQGSVMGWPLEDEKRQRLVPN
ncbi:hypothetical protein GW17_00019826 [Ensete ventricosum]|nr:hypothetical protein GW17_00019826 [Ensete ventricosum]RZR87432.1 hypothetical protein BHM03_00014841 [Ensete ventricosum]